jgi:serine/threonine protein kinase
MSQPVVAENLSVESLVSQIADEFLERVGRGERPDVEEYADRHPALAAVLRQILPALQVLRGPAEPMAALSDALGDFRILREIGRGGMGVVYEAEQVSLGRRVALKVLPFAAALDPRHLQRFKNEAQAAAQLHHPNIVPVHGVGCERGVHFYAMQFIEGQTLAEVIAELRSEQRPTRTEGLSPTRTGGSLFTERSTQSPGFFRAMAQLGVQAAEALEHAHQLGVVHRDVKPANLLLDASGRLWVADFGLARCRAEPGLTGTGDVVGTLRYMSPEQALAKHALVDHRSDIYSLGATLHEALTLQPAYPGRDREELLRQIAIGEPRAPRGVNRSLPVALETVVLKAMAREPQGRYATAREMAEDLQRFLEGRPVLALRPTRGERLARWGQRHWRALAIAAGVLGLAALGLLIASFLIWREREQKAAALVQARVQGQRAEQNFRKALEGATRMLLELDPKPDAPAPGGDELRQALVKQGLQFFQDFIDEDNPDPAVRFESVRAYKLMASVYCSQRKGAEAQAMMRRAVALLLDLENAYPEEALYRKELVQALYLKGILYKSLGQAQEAREEYARAAEQCRGPLPNGDKGSALNVCAYFLVDCPDVTVRDPARAVALAEQAVTLQPRNGYYWHTLGVARYRSRDWRGAVTALERTLELNEGGGPHAWFFLAMSRQQLGDREQARTWYGKAANWMQKHRPPAEDLLRYWVEAATLLGDTPPVETETK